VRTIQNFSVEPKADQLGHTKRSLWVAARQPATIGTAAVTIDRASRKLDNRLLSQKTVAQRASGAISPFHSPENLHELKTCRSIP
jgi:hypothetical protein